MVLSRLQKGVIMTYILETLFDQDPDSDLHKAMAHNKATDPLDLTSPPVSELDGWMYKDDTGTHPLARGNIGLLKIFKAYSTHMTAIGTPLGDANWLNITVDQFNAFRTSAAYLLCGAVPVQNPGGQDFAPYNFACDSRCKN